MENRKKSICDTCKYWDRRFPENLDLGVCLRMGVTEWTGNNHASISMTNIGASPVSDFDAVRTRKEFGCIFHSDFPDMVFSGA